jgi:DNA invertase Pin-like site-specific DNA recombinase
MLRCAIYTRKSTEEGLDQDFNSLHAQRESCESFIESQRHEGWKPLRAKFDDGGYSGGTMNRPALQDLLEAVEQGKVDIIVVYKVDRLTRSLADFDKIVEQLDDKGVSFVSVTQQFNTTSSMGRLTLNVLLSFAQFEREVTAERIRDKIAASKKKGLWMGGPLPLGYDVTNRQLVINDAEAKIVRKLFQMYLDLGTVRRVKENADRLGIVTKQRRQKNGTRTGGKPFSRGNLYQLLSNPLYNGCIPHKGNTYPGQHAAIIKKKTWDIVQSLLSGNASNRTHPTNTRGSFLLTGKVFDETGQPLYQHQTHKRKKRYCYYISKNITPGTGRDKEGWRLPAKTLEDTITAPIFKLLQSQSRLIDILELHNYCAADIDKLGNMAASLSGEIYSGVPDVQRPILQAIIQRIDLTRNEVSITLDKVELSKTVGISTPKNENPITLTVPIRLQRRGIESKLVIESPDECNVYLDRNLCRLIAQAHHWFDLLASKKAASVREISKLKSINENEITRTLPLAFLAPEIILEILNGRQPEALTAYRLKRLSTLPLDWLEQVKLLNNLA